MAYCTYFACVIVLSISTLVYAQFECPVEGTAYLPHPNCSAYIACHNGSPIVLWCPDPLYFKPDTETCDWPENVPECVGGTRPPGSGTTTPTTTAEATTTTRTTTTTEPELPNGCPSQGFKLIPHPTRCEFYFACQDGDVIGFGECPEGLYFDPGMENCNFQHLVNCTNPTTTTTAQPTTTTTTAPPSTTTTTAPPATTPAPNCPPTGIVNLPYPGNCTLYTLCLNGAPILSQCPTGTKFDLDSRQCKPISEARCDDGSSVFDTEYKIDQLFCPSNVEFTKMPMVNDCQSWYECKNGKRISSPEKCPSGLHFYDVDQTCVSFRPNYCSKL